MDPRTLTSLAAFTVLTAVATAAPFPVGARPSSSASQASQQLPPTFRTSADFVEVDAVVVDGRGGFVRGLGKADFILLEDGKPREIATYELIDIPRGNVAAAQPEEGGPGLPPRGRLYFIVLDDLHIPPEGTSRARELATQFVTAYLGPDDRAAVLATSGRTDAAQEITGDRKALIAAIGRMVGHKVDSPAVMRSGGGPPAMLGDNEANPGEYVRFNQVRSALDTLTQIAGYAMSIRGRRKALVTFSQGMDVDLGRPANNPPDVRDLVRRFIDTSNRANLSLYAIDSRGVTQGGEHAVDLTGKGASLTALQDELKWSQEGLQTLAAGTGGHAFVNTGNFDRAFGRIVEANSAYYLLSYLSESPADGKFHKIELKTTRGGLTVRARPGFVKPAAGR